jgi:hypothetical protein
MLNYIVNYSRDNPIAVQQVFSKRFCKLLQVNVVLFFVLSPIFFTCVEIKPTFLGTLYNYAISL